MLFVGPGLRSVELHAPTGAANDVHDLSTPASVGALLRQGMQRVLSGNGGDRQGGGLSMQLGASNLGDLVRIMGAAGGGMRNDAVPSPAAALQRAMDAAAIPAPAPPTAESAKPHETGIGHQVGDRVTQLIKMCTVQHHLV